MLPTNQNLRKRKVVRVVLGLILAAIPHSVLAVDEDSIGWWSLNESSGSVIGDAGGNGLNGTLSGTYGRTTGVAGNALSFSGTAGRFDCGASSLLTLTDNVTIELWIKPTAWPAQDVSLLEKYVSGQSHTTANYQLWFGGTTSTLGISGKIRFYAQAGGVYQAVSPTYTIPSLNTWYHVTWTYSAASGGKLYINRVLQGSTTGLGLLSGNSGSLRIGNSGGYTGYLDEVRIYDRIVPDTEVQGLVSYWAMDEGSGTSVSDISGKGHTGTISGPMSWTDGKSLGKALNFNNLGDASVSCGTASDLNIADNLSVEFWIYPRSNPTYSDSYLFQGRSFRLYLLNVDNNTTTLSFGGTAGGASRSLSNPWKVPAFNTWYHVAWTYNSVTGGCLYVNGVLDHQTPGCGILSTIYSAFYFGYRNYNGILDEIKVYNRLLSAQELASRRVKIAPDRAAGWITDVGPLATRSGQLTGTSMAERYWKGEVNEWITLIQGVPANRYLLPLSDYTLPGRIEKTLPCLDQILTGLEQQTITTDRFLCHVLNPLKKIWVLPFDLYTTIPGTVQDNVTLTACPGEYESGTFVVSASDIGDAQALLVEVTDLLDNSSRVIPANSVDVKIVKCWYQSYGAGGGIWTDDNYKSIRTLCPELLVKDDALVMVDYQNKQNYLRLSYTGGPQYTWISNPTNRSTMYTPSTTSYPVRDNDTLQPVTISTCTNKQFWLTIKVPDAAAAGNYTGRLRLKLQGVLAQELDLNLTVIPFHLAPSPLTSSIYYRATIDPNGVGTVSSEAKNWTQFQLELADMMAHGVNNPAIYATAPQVTNLPIIMSMRNALGMDNRSFYYVSVVGNPTSETDLNNLKASVQETINLLAPLGVQEVYFYGIDEATGELYASQRPAWQAVHDAGGKIFAAGGDFSVLGDLQDVCIYPNAPSPALATQWHSNGHKIWSYANPQVGVEDPEVYRCNYGLLLWKNNYDGAANYAYQHSFGNGWNDFDDSIFRDHNFTYPTAQGPIDTIQWEGYREGVDDLRYLATLQAAIAQGQQSQNPAAAQAQAQAFLQNLDVEQADLDAVRSTMIDYILQLQTAVQGQVTLEDYVGPVAGVPVTIQIQSDPIETHVVNLDANGIYSFSTSLIGSYDMTAKADHWLSKKQTAVTVGDNPVNFSLANGDADGNNEIRSADLTIVLADLDSVPISGNWDSRADLDGDQQVSSSDLSIVLANLDRVGE